MEWSISFEKRSKKEQNDSYQHILPKLCGKLLTKLSTRYEQSYQQFRLKTLVGQSVAKWKKMQ